MEISFVVPVYNCRAYLAQCVNCLLGFSAAESEILLIDDGSVDGSGALCDRLTDLHPRVRCIHQQNKGVSAARNRGIEEAVGEYLVFVDADDTMDTSAFTDLLDTVLTASRRFDLTMYGMAFDYYRRGKRYRSDLLCRTGSCAMSKPEWRTEIAQLYACNYLSPVWNKLFRRSLLLENALRFDERMFLLEDLHFSLRCLACCETVYCSDKLIYRYRQTEDEGNAGRRLKRIPRISALIDKLQGAFCELADSLAQERSAFDDQLADIFFMLARQKIQVSDRKTISEICGDLDSWLPAHTVSPEKMSGKYIQKVLQHKVAWLYWRSRYSALRHRVANFLKYLRFRRRKGESHGEAAPPAV